MKGDILENLVAVPWLARTGRGKEEAGRLFVFGGPALEGFSTIYPKGRKLDRARGSTVSCRG